MSCRVGITTDPDRRKKEWENQHPTLRNWKILSKHDSKTKAQSRENQEARNRGCVSGSGGGGPEYATWYVYYFEY